MLHAAQRIAFARSWPQQKPGFSQKPGFLGVFVEKMSVLADPRNPVGKKPGFLIQYLRHFPVGRVERSGTRSICWVSLRYTQPTKNGIFILAKVLLKKPGFCWAS
jgi:hypothetical protein